MSDPIDDLEHGHEQLSALLLELRAIVSRLERGDLSLDDGVGELGLAADALKDAMAIHFSREAEALFPFVEAHVPSFVVRAEALGVEHDSICKRAEDVSRACGRLASSGASTLAPAAVELAKLEEAYGGHATAERAFLGDLRKALDDERREELRLLLLGL